MRWKDPHRELPNEKDGFGIRCIALCKINKEDLLRNLYIEVYFEPNIGWLRNETEEPIFVIKWIYINENFHDED